MNMEIKISFFTLNHYGNHNDADEVWKSLFKIELCIFLLFDGDFSNQSFQIVKNQIIIMKNWEIGRKVHLTRVKFL